MTVFLDDWAGTNGDPWNSSKWATSVDGSATVDIQSNEGRFLMNGNQTRGRAVADHSPLGDSEVLVKIRASATGSLADFTTLRGDGQWVATQFERERPTNGYVLQRTITTTGGGGNLFFVKMLNGVRTTIGSLVPWAADTGSWWVRYEVFDSGGSVFLRFKTWADGSSEPGSWALTVEDTAASHSSGVLQLSAVRAATGARSIFWDDLTLDGTFSGATPASVPVGGVTEVESAGIVGAVALDQSAMVAAAAEGEQANTVTAFSPLSTVGAGWGVPIGIS